MIGSTLDKIAERLNQYICEKLQLPATEEKVTQVGFLHNLQSSRSESLVIKMIRVGEDAAPTSTIPSRTLDGSYAATAPPIMLDLHILIASNCRPNQTSSGLDLLTHAIDFLHEAPTWDRNQSPELPDRVSRLRFEMETLDFEQQASLWTSLGSIYLPSVIYKVQMLLESDSIDKATPVSSVTPSVE